MKNHRPDTAAIPGSEDDTPDFTPEERRVLDMIYDNNLPGLKRALAALLRTPDNADDDYAMSSLMDCCMLSAAEDGQLDIIKFLYEESKLAKVEPFGYPYGAFDTPLLYAAAAGEMEVVKYLLHAGANPFAIDESGLSVVQNAIGSGKLELAKYLIEDCKLPWQGYSWEGISALHIAVESQEPEMFEYILQLGALAYDQPVFCPDGCRKNFPITRYIDSFIDDIAASGDPESGNVDDKIKVKSLYASKLKKDYLAILARYQPTQ
jgi:hypothetical protein